MNKKQWLTYAGALFIIIFSIWFYMDKLQIPNRNVSDENNVGSQSIQNITNSQIDDSLSKIDSQGAVSIKVTPLLYQQTSEELIFEITMNTHSVDLLQYQLDELVQLSFGTTVVTNGEFEWELTSEDSHHLAGILKWKGPVLDEDITLVIKDFDSIPTRKFQWKKTDI